MPPPFPGAGSDPRWEPDPLREVSDPLCFSKQWKACHGEASSWPQPRGTILLLKQPLPSRKLWNWLLTLYVSIWLGHATQLLVKNISLDVAGKEFFLGVIKGSINRLRVGGPHSSS